MDWLNFRHLYSFWMVARTGSFTKAAEEMHVAQSAVSSQVAALEDYLDEALFLREHRAVELTPAGQHLLGYAEDIFSQSRAINALFRDKERLQSQRTIRIGVVGGASRNFVYRLLDAYTSLPVDVQLAVSTGSYNELYGLLKRFEVDYIVSVEPPRKKDLREVAYERLGESKMCLAATPELMKEVRSKSASAPLDVYKFRHPFEVDILEKFVRPLVKRELTLRVDTDDIPLLRFFANSGRGVAILPEVGVLEDLESGAVKSMTLSQCPEVFIYGIRMTRSATLEGIGPSEFDLGRLMSRRST